MEPSRVTFLSLVLAGKFILHFSSLWRDMDGQGKKAEREPSTGLQHLLFFLQTSQPSRVQNIRLDMTIQ